MKRPLLYDDDATYRIDPAAVPDLVARGVIRRTEGDPDQFELTLEHVIGELEPYATEVGYLTGAQARGETSNQGLLRMLAVRFMHRDGQGGAH